jgi:hypothetical protein
MALNFFSNWAKKRLLFVLTAPSKPIDLGAGAKSCVVGSASSGDAHTFIRKPCCWKWHSSWFHKSILAFLTNPVTAQSSTNQQKSVKSVTLTWRFRTRSLLLNRGAHIISNSYLKLFYLDAFLKQSTLPGDHDFCERFMVKSL